MLPTLLCISKPLQDIFSANADWVKVVIIAQKRNLVWRGESLAERLGGRSWRIARMSFWRNRVIILAEILKPPLGHLQEDQIFLIKYLLYINSSKYFVLILTLQFSEDKSFDEAFFRIESRLSRWGDEPYPLGGGVG